MSDAEKPPVGTLGNPYEARLIVTRARLHSDPVGVVGAASAYRSVLVVDDDGHVRTRIYAQHEDLDR